MKTRVTIKEGVNAGFMTLLTPSGDAIAIDRHSVKTRGYAYTLQNSIKALEGLNYNGRYDNAIGYARWLAAKAVREDGMYVSRIE